MKTGMILGLTLSSLFITSLSAAEMTDTMMKKDTMMTDATMMAQYKSMSVAVLAQKMGYTWSKDRAKLAKEAGITNYRGTVKQNLAIKAYLMKAMMMKKDTMMNHDTMMTDNTMMKKSETMMKKESGMYSVYSPSAVSASLAAGKSVYLFFHATWCPGCRSLDTAITNGEIPAGSVIYKVDYDTNESLRKEYGVTMQHTVIKLNTDGTMMKKILGPTSIMGITK